MPEPGLCVFVKTGIKKSRGETLVAFPDYNIKMNRTEEIRRQFDFKVNTWCLISYHPQACLL